MERDLSSLDNDQIFEIETLENGSAEFWAQVEAAGGSCNCNCNSCNSTSVVEQPEL